MKYKSYRSTSGFATWEFVFRIYIGGGALHARSFKRDKVECGYGRPREPERLIYESTYASGISPMEEQKEGGSVNGKKLREDEERRESERERERERARESCHKGTNNLIFLCPQANPQDWLRPPGLRTPHRQLFMHMQPAVTGRTTARCHLLHVPLAKTLRVSCSRTSPAITLMYVIISRSWRAWRKHHAKISCVQLRWFHLLFHVLHNVFAFYLGHHFI